MSGAGSQLSQWFGYLKQFQQCASQANSDAGGLTLRAFACTKPATLLPDDPTRNQVALCCSTATSIPVQAADLCAAATFGELLGATFGVVDPYVAAWIQSQAPAPFNSMNLGDFVLQKTGSVYPKGAADPAWMAADKGMAERMDASCYSNDQRTKVAAIVSDPTKCVSDIVNQIVVLG